MAATCPECDSDIDIEEVDVDIGDELSCSECGALLSVATLAPLELELADDDDDDDEDEDEEEKEEEEEGEEEEDDGWGDREDGD